MIDPRLPRMPHNGKYTFPVAAIVRVAIGGWCLVAFFVGCRRGQRVERFPIAGTVTHDGRPVPQGAMWFEPTPSIGAFAATGFAIIENGSYRTQSNTSPGKGRFIVRIIGRDGTPPLENDLAEMVPIFALERPATRFRPGCIFQPRSGAASSG